MPSHTTVSGRQWVQRTEHVSADAIEAQTGLSAVAAQCLARRIEQLEQATPMWLNGSLDALHDPYLMHNMDVAIERLRTAIADLQHVRIITDYDVDGATSSLILQAALRVCAPDLVIDYHIPNRFLEGYGFSALAAQTAAKDGVDLIVTADIGVRDHAAIAAAYAAGVDVLVCDHHLPDGVAVPDQAIVLCPKQEACDYPNPHLAACGVSLKLAQALLSDHPRWELIQRSMLKLAAIGTVADVVSLRSAENRTIVIQGLHALREGPHHAGLTALLEVCGVEADQLTAKDIGWKIGPRINAAGRLEDASLIVDLLQQRDPQDSQRFAERVERINTERKEVQDRLEQAVLEQLDTDDLPPFVVASGLETEGWHRGVVGIVAGRIKERVHRPTAIVSIQGPQASASVRGTEGFHVVEALDSARHLLVRYGGHAAAAGFTVHTEDLQELTDTLQAYAAKRLSDGTPPATIAYDVSLNLSSLSIPLLDQLTALEPFGQHYPEPVFLIPGVTFRQLKPIHKRTNQQHVGWRMRIVSPQKYLPAVWWTTKDLHEELSEAPHDVLVALERNVWNNRTTLQLSILDARLTT